MVSTASRPSNFKRFVTCLEMASMFRLKVDAALAVPVFLEMICLRPCMGAANAGFLS